MTDVVNGVTKIGMLTFGDRQTQQAEYIRKMILSMSHDIRVLLVKLADRVHNMRTLEYMEPDKRKRIARETLEIYAPLAGRLGMFRLKAELEDLSFFYLEPRDLPAAPGGPVAEARRPGEIYPGHLPAAAGKARRASSEGRGERPPEELLQHLPQAPGPADQPG